MKYAVLYVALVITALGSFGSATAFEPKTWADYFLIVFPWTFAGIGLWEIAKKFL